MIFYKIFYLILQETPEKNLQNSSSPKDKKKLNEGESPSGPKKIIKAGGLVVEDIKIGNGAEAKNGKHVSIMKL